MNNYRPDDCSLTRFSAQSMYEDLGTFGDEITHLDGNDSWMQPTAMSTITDTPDDYDDGRMFLTELGVFVSIKTFLTILFWGLRLHGGSPVRAPPGEDPVSWAVRLGLISYASTGIADGAGGAALAALPNGELLKIGKEINSIM